MGEAIQFYQLLLLTTSFLYYHVIACIAFCVGVILLSLMSSVKTFTFELFSALLHFSQQVRKAFAVVIHLFQN